MLELFVINPKIGIMVIFNIVMIAFLGIRIDKTCMMYRIVLRVAEVWVDRPFLYLCNACR